MSDNIELRDQNSPDDMYVSARIDDEQNHSGDSSSDSEFHVSGVAVGHHSGVSYEQHEGCTLGPDASRNSNNNSSRRDAENASSSDSLESFQVLPTDGQNSRGNSSERQDNEPAAVNIQQISNLQFSNFVEPPANELVSPGNPTVSHMFTVRRAQVGVSYTYTSPENMDQENLQRVTQRSRQRQQNLSAGRHTSTAITGRGVPAVSISNAESPAPIEGQKNIVDNLLNNTINVNTPLPEIFKPMKCHDDFKRFPGYRWLISSDDGNWANYGPCQRPIQRCIRA